MKKRSEKTIYSLISFSKKVWIENYKTFIYGKWKVSPKVSGRVLTKVSGVGFQPDF